MVLRFSLRSVFIAVALLGVILYALFVRPTVIAERFVNAVEERDYDAAQQLMVGYFWEQPFQQPETIEHIDTKVLPREWSDICSLRRRVVVDMQRHDPSGWRSLWATGIEVDAKINGVRLVSSSETFK